MVSGVCLEDARKTMWNRSQSVVWTVRFLCSPLLRSCDLFQLSRFQDGTIPESSRDAVFDDIGNVNDKFNLGRNFAVALLPISPKCFPEDGPR